VPFDLTRRPRGHGALLEGLWRAAASGRLPHALLLRGPEGVGKFLAARWLAAGLLCQEGPEWPCGACGPCKRVASDNHPDLFVVDAVASGERAITIPFVAPREGPATSGYSGPAIGDFLTLCAMEGGWRVVIVRELERMNVVAQNAFLKTLEEPGRDVLLVLECSRPAALLDTIKSRVVPLALDRLSTADAAQVLEEVGVEDAALLARWSQGAPGVAQRLAARNALLLREIVLGVARGERNPVEAAAAIWEVEGDYPGKTPSAKRLLRAQTLLDVGLEVWLDLERSAAGADAAELPHGDCLEGLWGLPVPLRERRLEAWLQARQDIALNLSPEALVDRALAAAALRD
jgi:hypothetical protein